MATVQRGIEDKSLVSERKLKSKVAEKTQSSQSKCEIKSYKIILPRLSHSYLEQLPRAYSFEKKPVCHVPFVKHLAFSKWLVLQTLIYSS